MKTLADVSALVGMTRRMIQEYEKAGLCKTPTETNKYGHLLYSDKAIEQLWQIRFYRELGYDKKHIKAIFDNKNFDKRTVLSNQIVELERKKDELDALIKVAKAMEKTGLTPAAIRFGIQGLEEASYNMLVPMLGTMFNIFQSDADIEDGFVANLTEGDWDVWFDAIEEIARLSDAGANVDNIEVQEQVSIIHGVTAKEMSDSVLLFAWNTLFFAPDGDIAQEFSDIFEKAQIEFLYEALRFYCKANQENSTDKLLTDSLKNIEMFARQKKTTNCDEVQSEVAHIHEFLSRIRCIKPEVQIKQLVCIGKTYGSSAYRDVIDDGAPKGISWFFSRAIEIYCDRLEQAKNKEDSV